MKRPLAQTHTQPVLDHAALRADLLEAARTLEDSQVEEPGHWLLRRDRQRESVEAWKLEGEVVIGRDEGGLRFPADKAMSGRHARLRVDAGTCVLEDDDSRNGTALNGTRVRAEVLCHGDRIRMGNQSFVYVEIPS